MWNIYEVTGTAVGTATVTITAVSAGETTVTIGGTTYAIHVAGDHTCHFEGEITTPATCTEKGYTTYTCSVCGDSYVADEVAALGHTPAGAVKENEVTATCTTAGSYDMVVYCSVCEEEISRESFTVDALGHDFVDGECSRCHEKEEAPVVNPFEDVPEGIYFYEPVLWAVEKNITKGTDDIHFSPNSTVNRAQVVTFLWRAEGSPEPTGINNPFVDVKEGDFFYKAVLWAVEQGITKGIDETHFAPNGECSRAQVVTFLWRAKGSPASSAEISFSDVKYNQYYSIAVAWAIENGITTGLEVGIFGVDAICNRAQAVTFLYRTYSNN